MIAPCIPSFRRQRGVVLVLSLLVLLMLTLLALFSMRQAALQERLAGNSRNLDLAFQAAEAALRGGEKQIEDNPGTDPVATKGWYHFALEPSPAWTDPAAWDAKANTHITHPVVEGVAQAPGFAIEQIPPVPDPGGDLEAGGVRPPSGVFRVSAIGYGGNGAARVILQTTFRR